VEREKMELTIEKVQQDLNNLGTYKTADVDKLIRGYVRQKRIKKAK